MSLKHKGIDCITFFTYFGRELYYNALYYIRTLKYMICLMIANHL